MPQFKQIDVTVSGATIEFVPTQNGATSAWLNEGDVLESNSVLTYTRRPSNNSQTTRKSSVGYTVPLIDECESTCSISSRGAILFKLDNVVSTKSTTAERTAAYDTFVKLLQDTDVRDAIINNGSFYA